MTEARQTDILDPNALHRAGTRVLSDGEPGASGEWNLNRLCRELEVHQIELATQNEELQRTRLEAERALERYTAFFDFAPIGYFVLGSDGTVRGVNLAGARLLGLERSRVHGRKLQLFVPEGERAVFNEFLDSVVDNDDDAPIRACSVVLTRADAEGIAVHVTASRLEGDMLGALVCVKDAAAAKGTEEALCGEAPHKDDLLGG